jgi:hypothetical protein
VVRLLYILIGAVVIFAIYLAITGGYWAGMVSDLKEHASSTAIRASGESSK